MSRNPLHGLLGVVKWQTRAGVWQYNSRPKSASAGFGSNVDCIPAMFVSQSSAAGSLTRSWPKGSHALQFGFALGPIIVHLIGLHCWTVWSCCILEYIFILL